VGLPRAPYLWAPMQCFPSGLQTARLPTSSRDRYTPRVTIVYVMYRLVGCPVSLLQSPLQHSCYSTSATIIPHLPRSPPHYHHHYKALCSCSQAVKRVESASAMSALSETSAGGSTSAAPASAASVRSGDGGMQSSLYFATLCSTALPGTVLRCIHLPDCILLFVSPNARQGLPGDVSDT
jgi:hypothetical protein